MKKNTEPSKSKQLESLKKELDSMEIEDRLEMVQLAAAEGDCCSNNGCCNNSGCDCGDQQIESQVEQ